MINQKANSINFGARGMRTNHNMRMTPVLSSVLPKVLNLRHSAGWELLKMVDPLLSLLGI